MKIKKIIGGVSYDERGHLTFNNDFDFRDVKRFYLIENDKNNFIRAWHGHKKESKYFFCVSGKFKICLVKLDNFKKPSKKLKIITEILDARKSVILKVPAGYANGSMNLIQDSKLMVFSNMSISQSLRDDYRYSFDHWNPWKISNK